MKTKFWLSRILTGVSLLQIAVPVEPARAQGAFMFGRKAEARLEEPAKPVKKPAVATVTSATVKLALIAPIPRPRPTREDEETEGAASETCTQCGKRPVTDDNREVARVAGNSATRDRQMAVTFRTRGKLMGGSCRRLFLNSEGKYGSVGRQIASLITSTKYKSRFINKNSLSEVCPKFSSFKDEDQKTKAWVWFWMVLANEESSCNPSQPHATHLPNGRRLNPKPGWGLFAAELHARHRNWRGPMCRGNIKSTEVQVKCAVDTMSSTQLARGRGTLWSGSYWGPVRRSKRQIMPNMKGFKACF